MITKQFAADDVEVKEGSREVIAIISTDGVDRDREVVLPDGLLRKQFNKNPLVLWSHNYDSPENVIGKCNWLKSKNGKIRASYTLADTDMGQHLLTALTRWVS